MDLVEQLRRDEGVRYTPYLDSLGFSTVGCGHKILPDEHFVYPMTDGEVNKLLLSDIRDKQLQLAAFPWFVTLDDCRAAAVTNMAFNVGVHGLLGFPHAISAIAAQDWQTAHDELLDSKWATQVKARATRIATQILTGEWQ